MKYFSAVLLCLMVIMPGISMAEIINDATLVHYYTKGKNAYDNEQWVTAIGYFFTYQELNNINTAKKSSLDSIDVTKFIQYSENKIRESVKCPGPEVKMMKKLPGE